MKIFEASLFISFLILFEFILVLLDPYIEQLTGGAPAYKLFVNGVLATVIFPLHKLLEAKLRATIIKTERGKWMGEIRKPKENSGTTLLLIVGFTFVSLLNISSSDKLDSLNTALKTVTHDTTKIKIRSEIGEEAMIFRIGFWDTIRTDARKWNMQELEAHAINNIGYIYMNQGQIKEALEYYGRSLKIYEDIGDKQGIATSLNNIGYIYDNQGQIKEVNPVERDSLFNRALEYHGRSLKIREDIGEKQGIAMSLNNIGSIYNHQAEALRKRGASPDSIGRQIKEALEYYGRSLKICEDIGDKQGIATSLNNIGGIYLKEKEFAKAKDYADSSLKVATELGYPAIIRNAAKLYADVYKAGSNYKDGWEMYELYVTMRDSVKNKENEKAAIRQHTRFEFEKAMIVKEQQEEEIKRVEAEAVSRRNTLQYSSIFLALIFLFGVVFFLAGISMPEWLIELSTFVPFMILFEFTLVLMDPYIDTIAGGEPLYKLLINALWAAVIFPIHSFFEKKLKNRISEIKRKKDEQFAEEFRKEVEEIEHSK